MFSYLNFKRVFTRKRGWTGILPYVRRAYSACPIPISLGISTLDTILRQEVGSAPSLFPYPWGYLHGTQYLDRNWELCLSYFHIPGDNYSWEYLRRKILKACLHGGGGPQMGKVTCGGSAPHLSCKRDRIKMRDYMDRRIPHLSGLPHLPGVTYLGSPTSM